MNTMIYYYIFFYNSFQWFLDRMADDNWWPMQILIKCPNQIVRQVSAGPFRLLAPPTQSPAP